MSKRSLVLWICLVLGAVASPALAEVRVVGKVLHAGFPCGAIDYYRRGSWCPVVASLQNVGDEHLAGRLVLHQQDKDGDVMVAETVLSLTARGEARTYRLDFVANVPGAAGVFVVRLYDEDNTPLPIFDEQGNPHEALPTPRSAEMPDDTTLVLDISSRPIGSLDTLADDSGELLIRPMEVVRFRPEDLPDRWYTLQAVQAIIWNAPRVDRLEPQQILALKDYVRAGGILVLAAGRTAGDLAGSGLGEILPATVKGTRTASVLQSVWKELLRGRKDSSTPPPYEDEITIARARAKPSATPVCTQDAMQVDMVTRGRVGSGVVVFVAADLNDLLKIGDKRRFLKHVLGLLDAPPRVFDRRRAAFVSKRDLYDYMHGAIGFEGLSGSFLVFVILFVAAYILTATLSTWWWLQRRSALHHSWVLFAVVALGCSVLSVGAVQAIRGVGTDVRQMCVVDVSVPSDPTQTAEASATAYFGLKSSTHANFDVRLASSNGQEDATVNRNCLQPLAANQLEFATGFVAPERYYLRAGLAMMEGVPIRATLKRLQGHWFGRLDGSFSAMIEMNETGRLSDRSWIRNDLGVDLHDCWLITSGTSRIGGESRSLEIYAHQIGEPLRSGGGPVLVGQIPGQNRARWPTLADMQKRWAGRFGHFTGRPGYEEQRLEFEMEKFPTALMLLTTLDEYHVDLIGDEQFKVEFARTHGLHLDRCHLLTNDSVMVVGFADAPGPVRLEIRSGGQTGAEWRVLEPDDPEESHTMYRFIVPVRRIPRQQEALW